MSRWSIWFLLWLSRLIGRPFVRVYIAVDGPRVVGTGTVFMLSRAGYVGGMATEVEYRRRGIASRILDLLQAEAARRGRDWLVLDVESENDTAIRVYQRAGYRAVGRFAWFTRPGLPPTIAPLPSGTRAASKRELEEIVPQLDQSRNADYRAALPATARVLSHNEVLVRGIRGEHQTWIHRAPGDSLCVVRAYYVPRTEMGVYFPMVGSPDPDLESLVRSFDPATEWLRARAPRRCLAIVPEPAGTVGAGLARLGFTEVVSTTVMVRASSP